MRYYDDVKKEAIDFIIDREDQIKDALRDNEDDNGIYDLLYDAFHETVTDRSYTPEDAIYVLDNSDNEETDKGLWQGLDWRDELSARAAFTFSNDVWIDVKDIYNDLLTDLEDRLEDILEPEYELNEDVDDDVDNDDNEDIRRDIAVNQVWDKFIFTHTSKPIKEGSEAELSALIRWITLGDHAGTWSGYPLGSSYIDARCGTGFGMEAVKDYVDFDNDLALRLSSMSGKTRQEVEHRIEELEKLLGISEFSNKESKDSQDKDNSQDPQNQAKSEESLLDAVRVLYTAYSEVDTDNTEWIYAYEEFYDAIGDVLAGKKLSELNLLYSTKDIQL